MGWLLPTYECHLFLAAKLTKTVLEISRHLLLLSSSSSSSSSPLCRVFILIFLRQNVSVGNTVLQLFCCYYSWCLYCQFHFLIYCIFYISTFRSMCAVSNMAVFCSSLTSCFPGMLLTYFLNDFEIVPVAPYYCWYHLCFYIPHVKLLLLLLLLL